MLLNLELFQSVTLFFSHLCGLFREKDHSFKILIEHKYNVLRVFTVHSNFKDFIPCKNTVRDKYCSIKADHASL